jgi:oligopeptide/dipeptide ABC transporter ATP-binding protein
MGEILLEAVSVSVAYGPVRAVRDVDLVLKRGEIVGIAGESGSGKTTLAGTLIRALPKAAALTGTILFDGRDLYALTPRELLAARRRDLAMVLQNPMTSLDPLYRVGDQVREVLRTRGAGDVDPVDLLRRVGLTAPELRVRQYPHELSGGMKQRVLIAMAAASSPRLLVADEPTSALDASMQEEILVLFRDVRDRAGSTVVIVSHDLNAIRRSCERTIVMYAGRIVEDGPTEGVFAAPRHPYTRALLATVPHFDADEVSMSPIPGQIPDLAALGPGCAFAPRCAAALGRCASEQPPETKAANGHRWSCWRMDDA